MIEQLEMQGGNVQVDDDTGEIEGQSPGPSARLTAYGDVIEKTAAIDWCAAARSRCSGTVTTSAQTVRRLDAPCPGSPTKG